MPPGLSEYSGRSSSKSLLKEECGGPAASFKAEVAMTGKAFLCMNVAVLEKPEGLESSRPTMNK